MFDPDKQYLLRGSRWEYHEYNYGVLSEDFRISPDKKFLTFWAKDYGESLRMPVYMWPHCADGEEEENPRFQWTQDGMGVNIPLKDIPEGIRAWLWEASQD